MESRWHEESLNERCWLAVVRKRLNVQKVHRNGVKVPVEKGVPREDLEGLDGCHSNGNDFSVNEGDNDHDEENDSEVSRKQNEDEARNHEKRP